MRNSIPWIAGLVMLCVGCSSEEPSPEKEPTAEAVQHLRPITPIEEQHPGRIQLVQLLLPPGTGDPEKTLVALVNNTETPYTFWGANGIPWHEAHLREVDWWAPGWSSTCVEQFTLEPGERIDFAVAFPSGKIDRVRLKVCPAFSNEERELTAEITRD